MGILLHANKICGTFEEEMKAYGQKWVTFCTHARMHARTHARTHTHAAKLVVRMWSPETAQLLPGHYRLDETKGPSTTTVVGLIPVQFGASFLTRASLTLASSARPTSTRQTGLTALDCVSQDLAVIDLPLAEAVRIAQHRIDWRAILRRVTSTLDDQQEL